jgi:hypothetical protein
MSNPTTPFSWQMPTATDLVTDLPADFEVFGQAVATSMADLLGGTSGQVLAKNSNTDMDFVWVTTDDTNAIQNAIVDAKGDLIGATAADTPARLAVGTNGQVLTADSTAATGLKWSSGAWTTWTPTLGNVVIGNGTITARYQQISKVIFFSVKVVFGSTTTISNSPSITLPVTAASQAYFIANVTDSGVASYTANAIIPSADFTRIYMDLIDTTSSRAAAAVFSATSPFTWATGDNFTVSGSYEVA